MKSEKFWGVWKQRIAISLCVACMAVLPVRGTHTEIWTVDSFEEFSQGESEHLSFTESGEVLLGPQSASVLTLNEQNYIVWALAEDSQGNTIRL